MVIPVKPVSLCGLRADMNMAYKGAQDVLSFLRRTPEATPEEFDRERQKYPKYNLMHGDASGSHALHIATGQRNLPLIRHILDLCPQAVNLGNRDRCTPLSSICYADCSPEERYKVVRLLVDRGADVNSATIAGGTKDKTLTPLGLIVRVAVLAKKADFAVIKLLLLHGAALGTEPLREEETQMLKQAREELVIYEEEKSK